MTAIGTFTKSGDTYTGTLRTLTLKTDAVLTPTGAVEPSHFLCVGDDIIGTASTTYSYGPSSFITVKLDDPSFIAPIKAALIKVATAPDTFRLVWSRDED
jgi:uncharacterized protein (DUF736 family)